ncbi:MAG: hypothetical protein HRT58_05740 [Crocinitomicaceae bacterium]|nr:hypothetical protein [Flavobacteriales bacterium]NQZ35143.1 hypothetical protein [Crocinitomicaceae bacterium]
MKVILVVILGVILTGCYAVNSETSEIGSMSPNCLDSLAWEKICSEHSIDSIKDPKLLSKLSLIKGHFIKPDYILYFQNDPEEIIGCNWYSIRVVYNEKLSSQALTGLSQQLSNTEQKRIRNRVLLELSKYQCKKGKIETLKRMKENVPFAESHEKYPLY